MKKQLVIGGAIAALTLMGAGCGAAAPTTPAQPTAAPAAQAPAELFPVGSKVLAKWQNGIKWYSGTVATASSGSYSINYDDGDKEANLTANRLAHLPSGPTAVNVGDKVIAKWSSSWYEATVTSVNGTAVKVHYADNTDGDVTTSDIAWAGK